MIDSGYLAKGLNAMARAHLVSPMSGHLGAAVVAGSFVEVAGDRRGSDEAHGLDVGVFEKQVDGLGIALEDIEYAFGKSGLCEEFGC